MKLIKDKVDFQKVRKSLLDDLKYYNQFIIKKIEVDDLISALNKAKSAIILIEEYQNDFNLDNELLEFKKLEPQLKIASLNPTRTGWITNWFSRKNLIQKASKNQFYAINPLYLVVNKKFIDKAHDKNLSVFPWTVDSVATIEKLVKYRVDGIITNNILNVRDVLNKLNT